ncbi:hypothetical protein SLS62_006203 [Diatrype stigma]|uniref:Cyanovirin-N domain-containing protein n=1 Tax=Diatrype stigma TaxID=117547 RepID=A0AAN9URW2_9PEZI
MKSLFGIPSLSIFLSALWLAEAKWSGDCRDAHLVDNRYLTASCPREVQGGVVLACTRVDLNNCYINDMGMLKPRLFGNYVKTCTDCELDGTDLTCRCAVANLGLCFTSSVNTDFRIGLVNGRLSCYGIIDEDC